MTNTVRTYVSESSKHVLYITNKCKLFTFHTDPKTTKQRKPQHI
uniref:Uncharacterized protein n=1 Tax=Arundo donax TaxID=35708 RepID=A0A0A9DS24_ARUDO